MDLGSSVKGKIPLFIDIMGKSWSSDENNLDA